MSENYLIALIKIILALGFILSLAWLFLRYVVPKMYGIKTQGQRIKVLEHLMLGQKRQLFLIEADNKKMLIGCSETSLTTLCHFDEAQTVCNGEEHVK